ncbi:hypothetical protein P3T18_003128 [Paraburkholderia sp. GAS199]|uniref:hypothetical protein n=1 Tax=Paraburkholderia sp. GAS199 TaxID=3035126 RepID=UPI003D1ABEC5
MSAPKSIMQTQPAQTFIPVHLPVPAQLTSIIVVECGAVRVRFDGPLDLSALRTVLATLRSSSLACRQGHASGWLPA